MLNVDATGVRSRQVAQQFLEGRGFLERIICQDFQELLGFRPKSR